MKKQIEISVRELVEFYYESGDLDMYSYSSSRRRNEGQKAHQKIQADRPKEYEKEKYISQSYEFEKVILCLRGRIDLFLSKETDIIIEEIKTIRGEEKLSGIEDQKKWWGQVTVYGAMYQQQEKNCHIKLQLTVYDLQDKQEHIFFRTPGAEELSDYINKLLLSYLEWAEKIADWQEKRDLSLHNFTFPYADYRLGQREMAVAVFKTIRDKGQLLLQAPTGTGKTAGVLYSSLKAVSEGHIDRIFYFTARTTGKQVAFETCKFFSERGMQAKVLYLTAKDKICFNPEKACYPGECSFAKGFYDRQKEAIGDIFSYELYSRELIEKISRRHHICPFEFSLTISLWSDCIIGDYNYGFDPRVYLRRFFEMRKERYHFLIDEAHNLVDRGRSMYSAELDKSSILQLRREVKGILPDIYKQLGAINKLLLERRKAMELDEEYDQESPVILDKFLRKFQNLADRWLAKNIQTGFRGDFLELYFKSNFFLACLENYNEAYRTIWRRYKSELSVKLFCLTPGERLGAALNRAESCTMFSATLKPFYYYQELFGCTNEGRSLEIESPFPPENLLITRKRIATRWRQRRNTLPVLTKNITDYINSQNGNVLVFFPSYKYMEMMLEIGLQDIANHGVSIQKRSMTERERESFLADFKEDSKIAGFAVLGGVFGEGIDLPGERLSALCIVGVGLPGIDLERELIRNYYFEVEKGYDFAYIIPGMTRVLQAAGRLIRSEKDKGSLLLIDDRFFHTKFSQFFPDWWSLSNSNQ